VYLIEISQKDYRL